MASFTLPDGRTANLPDTMTREEMTTALNAIPPLEKPSPSIGERLNAIGAGFNTGLADVAGLPVDTALNVFDLGKAAIGAPLQALTGDVQEWASPTDRSKHFGSSQQIRNMMGGASIPTENPNPQDAASRFLYTGGAVIPAVMSGSGGKNVGVNVLRAMVPAAAAQTAQEQLPEDASPTSRIAAQLLGGLTGGYAQALAPSVTTIRNMAGNVKTDLANALTGYKPKFDPHAPTAPTPAERAGAMPRVIAKPRVKLNTDGTKTVIQEAQPTVPNQYKQPPQPFDVKESDFVAPSGNLARPRQQQNIELMKELGLDTMRPGAVSGNLHEAGNEYSTSLLTNPRGQVIRDQLFKEQQAIRNYSGNLIKKTGANIDLAPEDTGRVIREPAQALNKWYDYKVNGLYQQAKQKAGELGQVKPENLTKLLSNPDFQESFLQSPAGTTLLGAIERQVARFKGIAPVVDGAPASAPATVNSAEALRKWLNDQWSPGNSALIGQVKEAIDMDVANVGGGDVYKAARQLHQQRKQTIDNPEGISLLNQQDKYGGINQSLYDEKVPAKVLAMPTVQFKHIVDTYKNMPEELQPQAQQALAEIKGAILKDLHTAGAGKTALTAGANQAANTENWNPKAVSQKLKAYQSKIGLVFTPDEIASIKKLHDAGYVIAPPKAYKGAAAQEYNMAQKGLINSAMPIGTVAGTALGLGLGGPTGGMAGSAIGGVIGQTLKTKIANKVENSMAQKLAAQLKSPKPIED